MAKIARCDVLHHIDRYQLASAAISIPCVTVENLPPYFSLHIAGEISLPHIEASHLISERGATER
jgi:hypothetical protein